MALNLGTVRTKFFEFENKRKPLRLKTGGVLSQYTLAYETYGKLNARKSNAILVFHAMTGSHHAAGINRFVPGLDGRWTEELSEGWWDGMIGPGKALDTRKFFIICANYLGGCYGSTGPASINPKTGKPWGPDFPAIRVCDIVDSQVQLLDHLGIQQVKAALGASIGGFLCLTLATRYPKRVRTVIPIASGLKNTILQRILNFEEVTAIEADPHFRGGNYYEGPAPAIGLALARRIAHKTFVSLDDLRERARSEVVSEKPPFGWYEMNHPVESYMLHQGEKFVRRFDANSYLRILDAWQWFNLLIENDAKSFTELFTRCQKQKFLIFSIDSDASFHPTEQSSLFQELKKAAVPAMWITVHSEKGHDSFLLEPQLFTPHIQQALNEE